MSRASRYPYTSDVTSNPKNVDDGYGRMKRSTGTVVVTGLKFNAWDPTPWQRSQFITAYGLNGDEDFKRITSDYNALIDTGHMLTIDDGTFKIIGVTKIRGAGGSIVSLSMIAQRVAT